MMPISLSIYGFSKSLSAAPLPMNAGMKASSPAPLPKAGKRTELRRASKEAERRVAKNAARQPS
jgi:hypothetical protein